MMDELLDYLEDDGELSSEVSNSWNDDHFCFLYRDYFQLEGDDCIHEHCTLCKRIRYEADGMRPCAWFKSTKNICGMQYSWKNPVQGDSIWKY